MAGGEFRFGTASIYMARHQQEVSSEWGVTKRVRSVGSIADWGNADAMGVAVRPG
jgi:hypothetical protein